MVNKLFIRSTLDLKKNSLAIKYYIVSKEKIIISRILKLDILLDVYQCVLRGTERIGNINIHARSSSNLKGDFYCLKMAMTNQSS